MRNPFKTVYCKDCEHYSDDKGKYSNMGNGVCLTLGKHVKEVTGEIGYYLARSERDFKFCFGFKAKE